MTIKTHRKVLARDIQHELEISYRNALDVVESENPPPGWCVAPSEYEVALERLRRASSQAVTAEQDPAAQVLAAFAALRVLEPHAWAPRCDKWVAGIDPHSGEWMEIQCDQAMHTGRCAPDEVLYFLWLDDMGPASESFRSLASHLRSAWRALGMADSLDQRVKDLVKTVNSWFHEDDVWANIPQP